MMHESNKVQEELENKFLELKDELVKVIRQLRKKPNNDNLRRRKEELTESMRAVTEMMIQCDYVDSAENEEAKTLGDETKDDVSCVSLETTPCVGDSLKSQYSESTCEDGNASTEENEKRQQLRQKSVEISKELEQMKQLESPSESDCVKRKSLEVELEEIAEELLQLEQDELEEETTSCSNCINDASLGKNIIPIDDSVNSNSFTKTLPHSSKYGSSDDLFNKYYERPPQHSQTEIRNAVEEARNRLAKRGEKLGQLGKNAEEMQNQAKAFMDAATQLNRREQRRNWFF